MNDCTLEATLDSPDNEEALSCKAECTPASEFSYAQENKFFANPATAYGEQIGVDDVAIEMNGLRCRFLQTVTGQRSDGASRTFQSGSQLLIENWNGISPHFLIDTFSVPKLVVIPDPERIPTIRPYVGALSAQRRAILKNNSRLRDLIGRKKQRPGTAVGTSQRDLQQTVG